MSFVRVGSLNVGDKFKYQDKEYSVTNIEIGGRIIAHTTKYWFDQIILTPGIIVEVAEEEKYMLGKFKQNLYRVTIAGKLKWTLRLPSTATGRGYYYTVIGDKYMKIDPDGKLVIEHAAIGKNEELTSFKFEKLLRCIEEVKQKENVIAELLPILEGM